MNSFSQSLAFDGFLRIPQLVSHRYCNFISDAISLTIGDRSSPFFRDLDDHCPDSFLSDIWSSHFFSSFPQDYVPDCLPAFLSSVINTDHLILLQDTWFSRTHKCSTSIPWHHDQSIEGPFFSVWISLTDVPLGSSLRFVRGSHLSGLRYLPASFFNSVNSPDVLSSMEQFYRSFHFDNNSPESFKHFAPVPTDLATNPDYQIIEVPTLKGDAIIFNGLVLHSLSSNGKVDTRGFVLRWVTPESVVSPYSNDAQIASKLLNIRLEPKTQIKDPFFKTYDFSLSR